MGTDHEIGGYRCSCGFSPPLVFAARVVPKFAGFDCCRIGHCRKRDAEVGHDLSKLHFVREVRRGLRPDDVAGDEISVPRSTDKCFDGAGCVFLIVDKDVDDDVAVNGVSHGQQPLISRMRSSVRVPLGKRCLRHPRWASKGLAGFCFSATSAFPEMRKVSTMLGRSPSLVRNCFGIVICPRSPIVAVVMSDVS